MSAHVRRGHAPSPPSAGVGGSTLVISDMDTAGVGELVAAGVAGQAESGASEHYSHLVKVLSAPVATAAVGIERMLLALRHHVAALGRRPQVYARLLNAVFRITLPPPAAATAAAGGKLAATGADSAAALDSLTPSYVAVIHQLVSSNGTFALPAFRSLVRNLSPAPRPPKVPARADDGGAAVPAADDDDAEEAARIEKEIAAAERRRHDALHGAIQGILRIAPSGASSLLAVLTSSYPHRRLPAETLKAYTGHVLRVCAYAPALRDRLLALVIGKLVEMDADLRLEDDDDSTADTAMADKLDGTMELVFKYVEAELSQGGAVAARLFRTLLDVFEASILPTHGCHFVQFLLFFAACRDSSAAGASLQDAFVSRLVELTRSTERADVTRVMAAAYAGSFLARSATVVETTFRSALCYLLQWCHDYLDALDAEVAAGRGAAAITSSHAVFHAVVQAAMYAVCFRQSELRATEEGTEFLLQFRWGRVLSSVPDPLHNCHAYVAREFVSVARDLGIELPPLHLGRPADKERGMGGTAGAGADEADGDDAETERSAGGAGRRDAPGHRGTTEDVKPGEAVAATLLSFFPFDPLLLRRCSEFVEPLYREWPGDDESGSEDDASDDSEREDEAASISQASAFSGRGGAQRRRRRRGRLGSQSEATSATDTGWSVSTAGRRAGGMRGLGRRIRGLSMDDRSGMAAPAPGGGFLAQRMRSGTFDGPPSDDDDDDDDDDSDEDGGRRGGTNALGTPSRRGDDRDAEAPSSAAAAIAARRRRKRQRSLGGTPPAPPPAGRAVSASSALSSGSAGSGSSKRAAQRARAGAGVLTPEFGPVGVTARGMSPPPNITIGASAHRAVWEPRSVASGSRLAEGVDSSDDDGDGE